MLYDNLAKPNKIKSIERGKTIKILKIAKGLLIMKRMKTTKQKISSILYNL